MREKTKVPSVRKRQAAYFRELDRCIDLAKHFDIDEWSIFAYVSKRFGYTLENAKGKLKLIKDRKAYDQIKYHDEFSGE